MRGSLKSVFLIPSEGSVSLDRHLHVAAIRPRLQPPSPLPRPPPSAFTPHLHPQFTVPEKAASLSPPPPVSQNKHTNLPRVSGGVKSRLPPGVSGVEIHRSPKDLLQRIGPSVLRGCHVEG